ncbi:hypothetical protein F3J44_13670 [Pantoea sp. Tr-811]|uniref:hypothetical protein n=1 Tax=unclassified Pantoea TaxID=2630326 RepID=UPI0014215791|nr:MULTISPECIES: hypothetical protein [unclassified Pantoea]NIE73643.1 hypothetical protein [Pantoea sp. Ap-967]NIF27418.1 hypothetical protein [Pantoea sp. Tr-811]
MLASDITSTVGCQELAAMNHSPNIALDHPALASALAPLAPLAHFANAADNERLPTVTVTALLSVRYGL